MAIIKPRKLAFTIPLIMFGAGYFSLFSSLELNPVLKDILVLVPIQFGVLAYLFFSKFSKASDS